MLATHARNALAALGALIVTSACSGDDGGGGGGGGGDLDPISIPAGQNVAQVTVGSTATAVAPAIPAGTYDFESIGFAPQRNQDEHYANFAQSGPTSVLRTLNFYGLHRVGTFACGERAKPDDDYAVPTHVDLKNYDGGGMYDSKIAGSTCEVSVTRIDAAVIEGRLSGTLVDSTNASNKVTITGEFRAHRAPAVAP